MATPTYFTSNAGRKINVTGITGKPLDRIQALANSNYGDKATALAKRQRLMIPKVPATPTSTSNTTPTPTLTNPPSVVGSNTSTYGTQSYTGQGNNAGVFPSERIFEPKNYQGSPLFQFQVQQGQDQLAKSLAAKGLTNSGYAIQEELNIPLRAAAQDTDRMTTLASQNADRLATMQENEAQRRERSGNDQWNRAFSIAQLMADQSPWTGALSGLNNYADITSQAGQAKSAFLKDMYRRILGGGGSGGGGGGAAGATATGPDYTNIMPTQIGADYTSNQGWLNLITKGLANLF